MRSHTYTGPTHEWIRTIAAPLLGAAVLSGGLHAAHWLGILPPARPPANPDETLMVCKGELIHSRHPAQVVLLGDSSCVTGIEAPLLASLLPGRPRVLNLGLYVGFGLDVYSEVLSEYVRLNPGEVRLVVLLVTPQFLMDNSPAPGALEFWRRGRRPQEYGGSLEGKALSRVLGVGLFKDGVLSHILHTPIGGGGPYGFTSGLAEYLARHDGSMIDLGTFHPPAHPILERYYLSPTLESASRAFRRCLPAGARLAVGITPVPESVCPGDYTNVRDELLMSWNKWMGADCVLTNAPAELGDAWFASRTHLNRQGQERYTRLLAALLNRAWERQSRR